MTLSSFSAGDESGRRRFDVGARNSVVSDDGTIKMGGGE